jgi:hypothetical protein
VGLDLAVKDAVSDSCGSMGIQGIYSMPRRVMVQRDIEFGLNVVQLFQCSLDCDGCVYLRSVEYWNSYVVLFDQ